MFEKRESQIAYCKSTEYEYKQYRRSHSGRFPVHGWNKFIFSHQSLSRYQPSPAQYLEKPAYHLYGSFSRCGSGRHSSRYAIQTGLTDSELHILRTINVRGCVVRCKDANGNIRLYGSKEYPLLGTVIEKTGTKASDLSGIEAIFSGKGAYPPLPVTEL